MAKLTPELYYPCRHGGQWRRQHVGSERKCLFQASSFKPKWPFELTAVEREAVIERCERLQLQLVERLRSKADLIEKAIGRIDDAARQGCRHVNDDGVNLLDRNLRIPSSKVHVICSLCGEDWYENEEGQKLHST